MTEAFQVITDWLILSAQLAFFFLPTGIANMSPVFFQRTPHFLAVPVDFGYSIAGEPLFGNHKTWRGLISATVCGGLFFLLQQAAVREWSFLYNWSPFDLTALPWWFGFAFAAGAILGDLVKSFFKRRVQIAPGDTWFPFDQIDFLLGGALVASFFVVITLPMWVSIFAFGTIMHIVVNHIGYWIGLKSSPW